MAETSGFFNASPDSASEGAPDRVYLADDFAAYFASFIGNGVFAGKASELQVAMQDVPAMGVKVLSGTAWINGYWYKNEGNLQLTIDVADGTYARIDTVVARWMKNERSIRTFVKKGTPSSNPSAPALQRDEEIYEIQLASIYVGNGITNVQQSMITDTRPDESVCGWVSGMIDQIDTEGLFAQYNAAFNEWFETIKGALEGDVAGNLEAQILDIQDELKKTVAIARGGTGATNAADARENLGAAASSHNHSASNITSGTLPIARGGTGASNAYAALQALGVKMGTGAAPSTGAANSIYIQLL